jgi:hypothetical protein
MNHDLVAARAADEIIELLTLCQQLQSDKDGRARAAPGIYSRDEDDFADRIRAACVSATLLRQLLPMMSTLSSIGAEMEHRGEITVFAGESYATRALEHLMTEYLPDNGDAR